MLCTIWFDLPLALSNLAKTILTQTEHDSIHLLLSLSKTIQSEYSKLSLEFATLSSEINSTLFLSLHSHMLQLNKERIDLQCKCIKQSIQLISKLISYIENTIRNDKDNEIKMKDVLIKIKFLLKITRIINDKSKEEIRKTKIKKEKKFFTMLLSYSEKIQKHLYEMSNNLIQKEFTGKDIKISQTQLNQQQIKL